MLASPIENPKKEIQKTKGKGTRPRNEKTQKRKKEVNRENNESKNIIV
jgi:hypothetical protein